MAVNSFFHSNNVAAISTEQSLYSNLVAEAIQIHGHDVFYMDRTIVAEDSILGGDTLSKFKDAAKIEMYMENADGGFAGEREIMNQFGLQNLSEATFVVNKIRFQELTKQVTIESDHDEPFFQLDNNPVYKLRCRLFDYASEELDTGIDDIDNIQGVLSTSTAEYQFTMESESAVVNAITMEDNSGRIIHENNTDELVVYEDSDMTTSAGVLLLENDADTGNKEYLIQEDYIIGDGSTAGIQGAQNELFDSVDDTVLDFSESNPFGDVGSNS